MWSHHGGLGKQPVQLHLLSGFELPVRIDTDISHRPITSCKNRVRPSTRPRVRAHLAHFHAPHAVESGVSVEKADEVTSVLGEPGLGDGYCEGTTCVLGDVVSGGGKVTTALAIHRADRAAVWAGACAESFLVPWPVEAVKIE